MAQIFPRRSNTIARASLAGLLLLAGLFGWVTYAIVWSPYITRVGIPISQPVPFSHEHHVSGLGIDCRYCHTSVEKSAFAGMPATRTCMSCHSQIWTQAPVLEPLRQSFAQRKPIRWNRVYDLPDFVSFDHSIHVRQGIGCSDCHGRVDQMPLLWKTETLYMKWCLECHRDPSRRVRERDDVLNMSWQPSSDQEDRAGQLVNEYRIHTSQLTDCSICHR